MSTERPYMKIIFRRNKVKELDDMIAKHFTMEGPIHYGRLMTGEEVDKELER
jgi:hypothetical protein